MSHPMYNPFAPGNQIPPQGTYGQSGGQHRMDPRRLLANLGHGSNFSPSGSSSVSHGTGIGPPSGGAIPSLLSLPVNYRPEMNKMSVDGDTDRSLDFQLSRAREEAMQTSSQSSQFANIQRDTFPSSDRGMLSHLTPPPTQGNRPLAVDRGSTSMDWSSVEESSKTYPSASSTFLGTGDGIQPCVGLSSYDTSVSDNSAPLWEAARPKYSSESATKILQQLGLQREDLDRLSSYPDDQMTPQNLPLILSHIIMEKEKRGSTAVQPTPYSKTQPIRSVSESDTLITSRGPVMNPVPPVSMVVKQSKVIEYGHTSKSELSSFGPPKKDTGLRQLGSEFPKTPPSKKSAPAHQATSKPQQSKPSSNLMRGVHSGRPGLVLKSRSTQQASKAIKGKKSNTGKCGQKQSPQMRQEPPHPKGFPATTKPPSLLKIPCGSALPTQGPSQMEATSRVGSTKHLPTLSMMEDYALARPALFPHTCSLCMTLCTHLKGWLDHRNSPPHLKACTQLKERYPAWDGTIPVFLRSPGIDTQPAPSSSDQSLQNRHKTSVHGNLSRSLSPHRQRRSEDCREKRFSPPRSPSPYHHHAPGNRRQQRRSRSRSPQTLRQTYRSPTRSYDNPTSSHYRSLSRSYEIRSPPWKREAEWTPPRESYERRSPRRRRSEEKRLSPRRSHERRSSAGRSIPQRTRSTSAERLAKRLLDKTGVQSLSKKSDLEAMVKTLAPVLLAELANLKSSSSAASSSSFSTTSASEQCRVDLSQVFSSLSYTDVFEAMEKFGKVKSLMLYRGTHKACVRFEREDDAKKLQSLRECPVKGLPVFVDPPAATTCKKPLLSKAQRKAPQKKSGPTKSQATKQPLSGPVKKHSSSVPKKTTTEKLVTKAKVLVSKAKRISTKQAVTPVNKATANGKSAGKLVGVKREASMVPKSDTAGKKPLADNAKKPATNKQPARDDKSAVAPKKSNKTAEAKSSTSKPQTNVRAKEGSAKASSEIKPKTVSSAQDQNSITETVEKQKQPSKKTNAQQGSTQKKSAISAVSSSDCSKNEKPPTPQTSSSVSKTPTDIPAGSSTGTSDTDPGKNAAETPCMDENVKVLSTPTNNHGPTEGTKSESKDSESATISTITSEDTIQENTPLTKDESKDFSSVPFDELNFNFGDFVTVDEINEGMDDETVEDHHSSSKPTSTEKIDEQSSASRKASTTRSSSSSSSSKPSKGSVSSQSMSSSANKHKSVSELKTSESKTAYVGGNKSSPSSFSKSIKTPTSCGQKAQSNKKKPAVKPSEPPSSGRMTRSSTTTTKPSVKMQQAQKTDVKPTKNVMAKSNHHVSAESKELEKKTQEKNQPAEGQMSQVHNQRTNVNDEPVKEMKKSETKEKNKVIDDKTTEKSGNNKNEQNLDSLNEKSEEQKNKDNQDRTETQIPEKDQIIPQAGTRVVESAKENKKSPKQDKTISLTKQCATQMRDSTTEEDKSVEEDLDEMVFEVLDAIEDDSDQETSATETVGRRVPVIESKKDKKPSTPVEKPNKPDKEDNSREKPVVTRSTRGRRENTTKKVEEKNQTKEDKSPTRRHTRARDSLKKDKAKSPLEESKPTKKSDNALPNTSQEDVDAVKVDRPTTQEQRREILKKDNKTSKKLSKEDGKHVHQIVDSLEVERKTTKEKPTMVASSFQKESETKAADVNTVSAQIEDSPQAMGKEDDNLVEAKDSPPAEGSAMFRTDVKEEKLSLAKSNCDVQMLEKREGSPKTDNAKAATDVLNLEPLHPDEENDPVAIKTEIKQEDRRSIEGENVDQMRQSSNGGETVKTENDEKQNDEMGDGSVTQHEIEEKKVGQAVTCDEKIREGELQAIITPNEISKTEDQQMNEAMLEVQPQVLESQSLDEDKTADGKETIQVPGSSKRKHDENTVADECKQEPPGPEAKRSRSESPGIPVDFQLPAFIPNNPLGEEFVVPKSGFFCNLCSIFYLNETTAKKIHCSSQKHYNNLQKHYQKLHQK